MLSLFKSSKPVPPLLQAIGRYQSVFDTSIVYSAASSTVMVEVIDRIEAYTDIIRHCIRAMDESVPVSKYMLGGDARTMSLGDFYLDRQGCYLDAAEVHSEFVSTAVELLHLTHVKTLDSSTESYNQRVTSHIIANLVELSTIYGQ